MHPQVAAKAVQTLSIDCANLMQRVAILQATLECLQLLSSTLDPSSWPVATSGEEGQRSTITTLSENQHYAITEILEVIRTAS